MSLLDNSVESDSSLAGQDEDTEAGEEDTDEEEDECPVSEHCHVTCHIMSPLCMILIMIPTVSVCLLVSQLSTVVTTLS